MKGWKYDSYRHSLAARGVSTSHYAKKMPWKDQIKGGYADKKMPCEFDQTALKKGIKVEMEHTNDKKLAQEIAMDHLAEFPDYYDALEKLEVELKKKWHIKRSLKGN